MAWIQPNSTVKILKAVPLDEDGENTFYFANATAQQTAFNSYAKYSFIAKPNTVSYIRQNSGSVRIEKKADLLYDCNYMMFQNTEYGTKWFYAFINKVNYINDSVSEVVFTIDDMQTWLFDFTLEDCFVVREHQATDTVGDNLVPEDLAIGEIMYGDETDLLHYSQNVQQSAWTPCVVVACPFDKTGSDANGSITGGQYSGLWYNIFSSYYDSSTQQWITLIDQLTDFFNRVRVNYRSSDIVTMFYFFKEFAVQSGSIDTPNRSYSTYNVNFDKDYRGFKHDYTTSDVSTDTNYEAYYVPKNKKLLTAPYNYITVTDWAGKNTDYAYEYFSPSQCQFEIGGTLSTSPAIYFAPKGYMGMGENISGVFERNMDYAFWYSDFPKVPWSTDGFVAWLAQTGVALAGGALPSLVSGAITSSAMSAGAEQINSNIRAWETNQILSHSYKSTQAQQAYNKSISQAANNAMVDTNYSLFGNAGSDLGGMTSGILAKGAVATLRGRYTNGYSEPSANWGVNNTRVTAVHKKIRREYAEIIDNYFTMYGYATKRVKQPNMNVRTEFTYTKTVGCQVKGNMPADSMKNICAMFDRGVRFWKNPSHIGNYAYANNIL